MIRCKLSAKSRRETALYGFLSGPNPIIRRGSILHHSCNQDSLDQDTGVLPLNVIGPSS